MKQRGQKSAAAVAAAMAAPSVIRGGFSSGKVEPPDGMPERQVTIWRDTVKGESPDLLNTSTARSLLQAYCRHRAMADEMAELIDAFPTEALETPAGMRRYEWLAKMHRVEAKAAMEMATKLRLTNQSRFRLRAAAAVVEDERGGDLAPWDVGFAKKA